MSNDIAHVITQLIEAIAQLTAERDEARGLVIRMMQATEPLADPPLSKMLQDVIVTDAERA